MPGGGDLHMDVDENGGLTIFILFYIILPYLFFLCVYIHASKYCVYYLFIKTRVTKVYVSYSRRQRTHFLVILLHLVPKRTINCSTISPTTFSRDAFYDYTSVRLCILESGCNILCMFSFCILMLFSHSCS